VPASLQPCDVAAEDGTDLAKEYISVRRGDHHRDHEGKHALGDSDQRTRGPQGMK
jgi:hypothetical protein